MSSRAQQVFKQQNLDLLRKSKHHWRRTLKGSNRSMWSVATLLLHASGEKVSSFPSALGKANRTWVRPENTSSLSKQQRNVPGERSCSQHKQEMETKSHSLTIYSLFQQITWF